jgi:hypothetical protein
MIPRSPSTLARLLRRLCGGCGWVEHKIIFWFRHVRRRPFGVRGWWLGTLLGPEETPVGVFSVPLPGLGVLTLPASVWGWWCLWDWVCGGVLSVA